MRLSVEDVTKKIKGNIILDHVNLTAESGQVYGIVGRNGSGKTMLFRAVSGLMKTDTGRIVWNDKELHRDMDVLPHMGIILEKAGLYPEYTGFENLRMLGKFDHTTDEEIAEAIQRVGLDPEDKRIYKKYSLGMKQRIHIAQAIMEKPDILLLDEPTNALDEDGVSIVRNIICREKERGAVILLASHNQEDIRLLADTVWHMEQGKLYSEEEYEKNRA